MADKALWTTEHARTAKWMWSRDMQIRLYLHDKSLRWSDWLLGEIFVVVGGFYSSFFVASQINRHKYCMVNANLFMYSELYFRFGNVVTDSCINVFIPYKYCTCAGSRLFVTGLTPSGRWNWEQDIGTYFTSVASSCHRELKKGKRIQQATWRVNQN